MIVEKVEVVIAPGFTENCYLLSEDEGATSVVVVDPGSQPDLIQTRLNNRKLDSIVLTHGHFDHIGAVCQLVKETGAEVIAHAIDAEAVTDSSEINLGHRIQRIEAIHVDRRVEEGDSIAVGKQSLKVIHTPGHTAGSICLFDDVGHILLSGDTLFFEDVGRTDFPTGDAGQQRQSIRRLFDLPDDTRVYPGHDRETTIGHEKQYGPMAGLVSGP